MRNRRKVWRKLARLEHPSLRDHHGEQSVRTRVERQKREKKSCRLRVIEMAGGAEHARDIELEQAVELEGSAILSTSHGMTTRWLVVKIRTTRSRAILIIAHQCATLVERRAVRRGPVRAPVWQLTGPRSPTRCRTLSRCARRGREICDWWYRGEKKEKLVHDGFSDAASWW